MKYCTSVFLVPFALAATGLALLTFSGCGKNEEKPVDPASPASYMNDKPFLDKLSDQKKERASVMQRHIAARKAYEEALKADPKGEKPETQALKKELEKLEAEYRAQRKKTLETVRKRITPKKDISK